MDKQKGVKNISVSIFFKFVMLFESILLRRFFIQYLGNELNGLSSLYGSIITFLSITELGVGGAIVFSMYKPIADGNKEKVAALYHLYKKIYITIGIIIFVIGLAVMPFLPYIATDYENTNVNLYFTFFLTLLSTVISYVFAAKVTLLEVHKYNYICTTTSSICTIVQHAIQILIIVFTRSFVWYLVCGLLFSFPFYLCIEFFANKRFRDVISIRGEKLDKISKKEIIKNTKAAFMHKIGEMLVHTTDNVIISAFIGITILGKYSNYTLISNYLMIVVALFFSSLSSVVGIACAEVSEQVRYRYLKFFHTFNFVLATISFLGYFAVIDDVIKILFGSGLEMARQITYIISLNCFISYMREAVRLFRGVTGCFYYDRWKALFEGLSNLVLSLLFVKVFPEEYALAGVLAATIATNSFIDHVVEPHVLFKHALKRSAKSYYIKNYSLIVIFAAALTALSFCHVSIRNSWASLFVNGVISLGFSVPICAAVFLIDKDFRKEVVHLIKQGIGFLRAKRKKKHTTE